MSSGSKRRVLPFLAFRIVTSRSDCTTVLAVLRGEGLPLLAGLGTGQLGDERRGDGGSGLRFGSCDLRQQLGLDLGEGGVGDLTGDRTCR
jgi:hypothetical protein